MSVQRRTEGQLVYLWDSDTLRACADGRPALMERLRRARRSDVTLPSVVVAEVLRGRSEYALKADTPERLVLAHRLLMQTWEIPGTFRVVQFDKASASELKQLRQEHRKHGRRADMLIASMAPGWAPHRGDPQ